MPIYMKPLQVAATLLAPAFAIFTRDVPTDCRCRNWQDVYASGGAECGEGNEFFSPSGNFMSLTEMQRTRGGEVCDDFFKRINGSFCVNVAFTDEPNAWYSGQWCYVPWSCLRGTHSTFGTPLGVKQCDPSTDLLMREWKPEDVSRWAQSSDVDVGFAVKMAYPVAEGVTWEVVNKTLGTDASSAVAALETSSSGRAAMQKLRSIISSGRHVVLDSHNGRPPFAVISGATTYLIDNNRGGADHMHPNTRTTWKCISGCPL